MDTDTDTLQFNDCKMFQVLRDSLPENKLLTQNLIDTKDDLLFAWNSKDCCLLAINWRAARTKGDSVNYQTLIPSNPQNFIIDKVLTSNETQLIALSGKRGVTIIELPRRYGANRQFQEGKEKIICRSFNLDENFFAHNTHIDLLQIRWHPASPTNSHLLVLLSDNTIRIYNESALQHTWRVGPTPSNDCDLLNSLGDTAVDFDIGPARSVTWNDENNKSFNESLNSSIFKGETTKIIWPIIILRGNGNIYILSTGIDSEKPRLQGPISMYPSVPDNYGLDFCSILVIPTIPTTVIFAENSGRLHQALLMESSDTDNEKSINEIDTSIQLYPSEWILNVLEIIELELGLKEKDNNQNICPIHLKRDLINEFRYFAYHNFGLHAVTVNFIKELQTFVETDDSCEKLHRPSLSSPSRCEYIVCTKALNNSHLNPVLGLTFLQSPSGLLLFLSSGQLISLDLITDSSFLRDYNKINDTNHELMFNHESPFKMFLKESIEIHIRNILKTGTSQPILKLDKSVEPTPQESFELLMQAIQILREQHFTKLDKARQELQTRVKFLQQLKEQQKREIDLLQNEQENIRENAERLAEIYEDTCERQQVLFKRSMELVRVVTSALPVLSVSEKDFGVQIKKINIFTQELAKKIDQTKKKINHQEARISQMEKKKSTRVLTLPLKQELIIQDSIFEIASEIDEQIKEIKKINNIVNVS